MKSKAALFAFTALMFGGCNLAPKYVRPCNEIPKEWRLPYSEASTEDNARWWEGMQDPILNDLIEEALLSNKDLKLAVARIDEFKAKYGIVSADLYPQITAQSTYSRQRSSQTLGGFGSLTDINGPLAPIFPTGFRLSPFSNDYYMAFNAAYQLDIWGRIRNASYASYAELLSQIEVERTVVLTLVSDVAEAYILLRQYDAQLLVSKETLKSRIYSYKLAKIRFEKGLTSELEVKQAAAEVEEAELNVIQFENLIPQQENLISILVGHPPQAIKRGKEIHEWPKPVDIPAGIPSDVLEQRPDIMSAEFKLIAANASIGSARALLFPDIALTGNYGAESGYLHKLFTGPSRSWQWAANLLQPIFEGGRILSAIDLTNAVKKEAYYNYQQTILTAFKEVDDALVAHEQAKKALLTQVKRVAVLKDYLHLATLQYENGLVDYLNVLDAERRLFDAQLSEAEAESAVFLTMVNIYKSLGGGWVIDAENQRKELEAEEPSLMKEESPPECRCEGE